MYISNMASQFLDDKSEPCLAFIRSRISLHGNSDKPLVIGLNGLQGVGKTTLVTALAKALQAEGVNTLVLSIDDLYLERKQQALLASSHALNPLVQHRGEPGTHDMVLAKELFGALVVGKETKIPQYNKAAFSGLGDRVPSEQWQTVNAPGQKKVQVIIFEGWCVGFRPLREDQVRARHAGPSKTLHIHRLEDLLFVNARLKEYDAITDYFDGFVYIDAEDTQSVYDWRLQQERALR